MPTYSYVCGACGGSFELEQRIVEDPIKTCALCGKPEARRQIVSGNFILKGGGWYSDGYGSSSNKSSKSESSKSEGSGGSSAKAKSDKSDSGSSSTKSDSSSSSSSSSDSSGSSSSSTTTPPKAASAD
jgi:putative FmdB family regulatory protein